MAPEPPVLPDGGEARRWAAEELAKPGYQRPAPAWLEDAWQHFQDWLGQLDGRSGLPSSVAGLLIVSAAVVIIVVAIVLVRPRLNARQKVRKEMYDAGAADTADKYRERADAAAAAGDLRAAVVESYRALVRAAEENGVIDARAGRTADEAAGQLGRLYPGHAHRLLAAAGTFDSVLYGHCAADRDDFAAMKVLDAALQEEPWKTGQAADSTVKQMQVPG